MVAIQIHQTSKRKATTAHCRIKFNRIEKLRDLEQRDECLLTRKTSLIDPRTVRVWCVREEGVEEKNHEP